MTHTPTPWHRNIPPAKKYPVIFSGRNTHVLVLDTVGKSTEEIEANCNFILRAVNTHDVLVAALEQAQHGYIEGSPTHTIIADALAIARN